jgi:hypothetical protein
MQELLEMGVVEAKACAIPDGLLFYSFGVIGLHHPVIRKIVLFYFESKFTGIATCKRIGELGLISEITGVANRKRKGELGLISENGEVFMSSEVATLQGN